MNDERKRIQSTPAPDALVEDIKIVLARDVDSTGVDWHKQLSNIRDLIKIHEKAVR